MKVALSLCVLHLWWGYFSRVKGHEGDSYDYLDEYNEWGGGGTFISESILGGRSIRQANVGPQMCRGFAEHLPRYQVSSSPCLSMEVFPGHTPRSLHVKLRFTRSSPSCRDEVGAVLAVGINQFGFPTGMMRLATDEPRPCAGEDLYVPKSQTGPNTHAFLCTKTVGRPYDYTYLKNPGMIYVDLEPGRNSWRGVCLTWIYDHDPWDTDYPNTPNLIQISVEAVASKAVYHLMSEDFDFKNPTDADFRFSSPRVCHQVSQGRRNEYWLATIGSKTRYTLDQWYINAAKKNPNWSSGITIVPKTTTTTTTTKKTTTTTTEESTTTTSTASITAIAEETKTITTAIGETEEPPVAPNDKNEELVPKTIGIYDWKTDIKSGRKKDYLHPPTSLEVYTGCLEQTKKCIVPDKGKKPEECLEKRTCDYVIAFGLQDPDALSSEVVVELYHRDPGAWFAIGICLNDKPTMSNSLVLECVDDAAELPIVYNSFNIASRYANRRLKGNESSSHIIRWVKSARTGGAIYCRFPIKRVFSRTDPELKVTTTFNLHKIPYYVIGAWGNDFIPTPTGNLLRHKAWDVHKKPKLKTLIGGRYAPTKAQQYLLREHGILMMWTILFFYPCGILVARYGKETLVWARILKRIPMWLAVHVLCMTLGTGLFIASMVIEVYGHVGWLSLRGSPSHIYEGAIMGGLLFLTFCHGWCVKTTYYAQKERNMGSIIHSLLGHVVVGMGMWLILKSETVNFSEVPCKMKWTVSGLLITYVFVLFGLSYHYCWVDWVLGLDRARSILPIPIAVLTEADVTALVKKRKSRAGNRNDQSSDVIESPGSKIRLGGLGVLASLGVLYAGWSTALLLDSKGTCRGDSLL